MKVSNEKVLLKPFDLRQINQLSKNIVDIP